jgi:hypothetical protein
LLLGGRLPLRLLPGGRRSQQLLLPLLLQLLLVGVRLICSLLLLLCMLLLGILLLCVHLLMLLMLLRRPLPPLLGRQASSSVHCQPSLLAGICAAAQLAAASGADVGVANGSCIGIEVARVVRHCR